MTCEVIAINTARINTAANSFQQQTRDRSHDHPRIARHRRSHRLHCLSFICWLSQAAPASHGMDLSSVDVCNFPGGFPYTPVSAKALWAFGRITLQQDGGAIKSGSIC